VLIINVREVERHRATVRAVRFLQELTDDLAECRIYIDDLGSENVARLRALVLNQKPTEEVEE
jgi:hypothetical protein